MHGVEGPARPAGKSSSERELHQGPPFQGPPFQGPPFVVEANQFVFPSGLFFALKIQSAKSEEMLQCFLQEVETLSALQGHGRAQDHIIQIRDYMYLPETKHVVILMELAVCDLQALFERFYYKIPVPAIYRIFSSLVQAVDVIHKRDIIHRDLKPGNFLLVPVSFEGGTASHVESSEENPPVQENIIAETAAPDSQASPPAGAPPPSRPGVQHDPGGGRGLFDNKNAEADRDRTINCPTRSWEGVVVSTTPFEQLKFRLLGDDDPGPGCVELTLHDLATGVFKTLHLTVKLTDFGLAQSLEEKPEKEEGGGAVQSHLSVDGFAGTMKYMAPEALRPTKDGVVSGREQGVVSLVLTKSFPNSISM